MDTATPENLNKKTQEINRLINKVNSGKNAWIAGGLLSEIKERKEFKVQNFASFGAYTTNSLKIKESKAYNYIRINQIYSEDELTELTLVSHLLALADKDQDIREMILAYARKIDAQKIERNNEIQNSTQQNYGLITQTVITSQKIDMRPEYTTEVIEIASGLLENAKSDNIDVDENLTIRAFELSKKIHTQRKLNHKLPNKKGGLIDSKYFPEVCKIFPNKPTCEMEVVGLFCVMFQHIKHLSFLYGKTPALVNFSHIEYLRVAFPDAEVAIINHKKSNYTALKTEFEFMSESYLTHGHNKSNNECHLIVCWENTLSSSDLEPFGVLFPPILSLKKLLDTGKIYLE